MWRLYKAVGGAESCVATGWTYGNHVSGTDTIKFTVTVDRGNISWKGDSLSHKYNELYGSYSDPEPFCIGGNNSTFGFYGFFDGIAFRKRKGKLPELGQIIYR